MNQDVAMEISVQDVKAQMDQTAAESDGWLLLDCREQQEYDTARIEGGLLMPMNEVPNRISEIDSYRDKPVVVFCHGGVRSLKVTQWLRQNGFQQSQSMAGGIDAWSKQIDPTVPVY